MKQKIVKHYKRWVVLVEVVLLLVLFPVAYNFFLPLGDKRQSVYFPSENIDSILQILKKYGYRITFLDKPIAYRTIERPLEGWYRIEPKNPRGRVGFFSELFLHPNKTMRIFIYGGDSKEDMLKRLAHDTKIPIYDLRKAYMELGIQEGDILAGRYEVPRRISAENLLRGLKDMSRKRMRQVLVRYGMDFENTKSVKTLFTVASIIQKETHYADEMPKIASVIYNRLAHHMKLQMDGTLNYGIFAHTPVTPERIRTDLSRYNTYRYDGLPPAPIGIFTIDALEAALSPAKTDYLYFVLQPDGKHRFARTFQEHKNNIFRAGKKRAPTSKH